jgi:hypothetical protein
MRVLTAGGERRWGVEKEQWQRRSGSTRRFRPHCHVWQSHAPCTSHHALELHGSGEFGERGGDPITRTRERALIVDGGRCVGHAPPPTRRRSRICCSHCRARVRAECRCGTMRCGASSLIRPCKLHPSVHSRHAMGLTVALASCTVRSRFVLQLYRTHRHRKDIAGSPLMFLVCLRFAGLASWHGDLSVWHFVFEVKTNEFDDSYIAIRNTIPRSCSLFTSVRGQGPKPSGHLHDTLLRS